MSAVRFKGIDVEFSDGVVRTVPPLTLRMLQSLESRLSGWTGGVDAASLSLVIDTVGAALRRNYPEATDDVVSDIVDVSNMAAVMQAVMGVSGVKSASGEAPATATPTGPT
jgi:hypothetical protein